jgi:hypothetical protein
MNAKKNISVPRRPEGVALARPCQGDHSALVDSAFALVFVRYEKALAELAKR